MAGTIAKPSGTRRRGLGRGPRDGKGPNGVTATTDENNGGKGLDYQSPPRKRKPGVAIPKGTIRKKSRNPHLRRKGEGITGDYATGAKG